MIDSTPGFLERPVYNPMTRNWEIPAAIAADDPAVLWPVFLALVARIERDWAALRGDRALEGMSAEDVASDIISELLLRWRGERVTLPQVLGRSRRRVIDLFRAATRHQLDHAVLSYLVARNERQFTRAVRPTG